MHTNRNRYEVRLDAYTRVCLTAITVLLTLVIIGLWADHAPLADQAHAKARGTFVESGTQAQLVALVKAQQKTVAKLDQLLGLLKSGQVKVRLVDADARAAQAKGGKNASKPARKP